MHLGLTDLIDTRLELLTEESRAYYENRAAGRGPNSLRELRAVRAGMPDPSPASPAAVEELVAANGRGVPLRFHTPGDAAVTGVFLEIHGGGFYMGSAAASDLRNRRLADALGVAVASVDYRLAPEHPWPAAPDDCETAALWLAEQAEYRFGTAKLAIGGASSGATLAMTTLLRLRDRGVAAFDCAV